MKWKPLLGDRSTDILATATTLVTVVAFVLLYRAGYLRLTGSPLRSVDLSAIGSFLGGLFAPVVLAWAARSFFLQREQLLITMRAMNQQVRAQEKANRIATAAIKQAERNRASDRQSEAEQAAPRLHISKVSGPVRDGTRPLSTAQIRVDNNGGDAMSFSIRMYRPRRGDRGEIELSKLEVRKPLKSKAHATFHIEIAEHGADPTSTEPIRCEIYARAVDGHYSATISEVDRNLDHFTNEKFWPFVPRSNS